MKNKKTKGISLIEVVIGLSIIFVSLVSVTSVYNFFLRTAFNNTKIIKAEFLLEEGVEAVRFIRDKSWNDFSNLEINKEYYLSFGDAGWVVTESNIYIDEIFERKFVLRDVFRDSNDDISTVGYLDSSSRRVDTSVSWFGSGSTSTRLTSFYLTNLFDN